MKALRLVVLLVLSACSSSTTTTPAESQVPRPATLVEMHDGARRKCVQEPLLRPACPELVPRVTEIGFTRSHTDSYGPGTYVFFAEWNAPRPGLTPKNAPPAFAHLNVFAGDLDEVLPGPTSLGEEPLPRKRDAYSPW